MFSTYCFDVDNEWFEGKLPIIIQRVPPGDEDISLKGVVWTVVKLETLHIVSLMSLN